MIDFELVDGRVRMCHDYVRFFLEYCKVLNLLRYAPDDVHLYSKLVELEKVLVSDEWFKL